MAPIERSDVVTNLIFLEKDSKHETEKPYKLQYDPGPGLPRWNCKNESHDGITIHDIRGKESKFTVENQGFEVAKLSTELSPEDFTDEDKVRKVYYNELKDLCKRRFGAQRVEVLEHGIRKRHHQFPISTGQPYNYDQPTSVVHIDFTQKAAMDTSQQAFNLIPTDFERVQCVNIWKPLYGPLTDWPLAVCDARTINLKRDCVAVDVVGRGYYTENYQLYPNDCHEWYYLNNHKADEVMIFRQTDTDDRYKVGVPHAGFLNTNALDSERPRESVEARVFLYY